MQYQDLSKFSVPKDFRGRSVFTVQMWWLVKAILFKPSPQAMYGWRRFLLRVFGANVGTGVLVRPSVDVTYPWKLSLGSHCWIGDEVVLYTLGNITIGEHSVISQRTYVCAADHDYTDITFPLRSREIVVGREAWVATGCFIGPSVTIGDGSVVGAFSVVVKDLPAGMICLGQPAVPIKVRKISI